MLVACEEDDLARLRQLFQAAGVHQGDPVVRPRGITYLNHLEDVPAYGPPTTVSLKTGLFFEPLVHLFLTVRTTMVQPVH